LNNELEELKQQKQKQRQRLAKITRRRRRTTTKKTQTPNFANSQHKLLPFSNTVAEPKVF
jgi:lipid II:glycine glycyltransferase (peptidoglycan interpeptide bridge formation enzyme)